MNRWTAAAALLLVLAGLFVWQRHRLNLVQACAAGGGIWDGTTSACRPPPQSPILQRDLRRS